MNGEIKRILFVITQSESGGAQRFLKEFLTRLDGRKYEITVAAGQTKTPKESAKTNPTGQAATDIVKALSDRGFKVLTLNRLQRSPNFINDWLAVFELKKIMRTRQPDGVFLLSSKAGFIGSLAALLTPNSLRPKVIYRIGGWTFNDPWPKWKKWLFIVLEKASAGWKDYIIVNNLRDFEQAKKLKIKPRKELRLIHNGIDALRIEFLEKEEARKKLKLPQEGLVIGTIANFYPTKRIEYLIDAFKILRSTFYVLRSKLTIIGDGPERKKLESRIKNYGLEGNVILTGQIPDAYKYLKAFDVFVLPSVKEGFPWTVLEAMAAKVPVVATDVGALPEIIENGPGGTKQDFDYGAGKNGILVQPGKSGQLAEAIKYLFENERARQELALQAHQTVLHKFRIEKMIKETEQLFSDENNY